VLSNRGEARPAASKIERIRTVSSLTEGDDANRNGFARDP
jgi:hypothetical protein